MSKRENRMKKTARKCQEKDTSSQRYKLPDRFRLDKERQRGARQREKKTHYVRRIDKQTKKRTSTFVDNETERAKNVTNVN